MVARVVWDHEAAGSSPVTSIPENHLETFVYGWSFCIIPHFLPRCIQIRAFAVQLFKYMFFKYMFFYAATLQSLCPCIRGDA